MHHQTVERRQNCFQSHNPKNKFVLSHTHVQHQLLTTKTQCERTEAQFTLRHLGRRQVHKRQSVQLTRHKSERNMFDRIQEVGRLTRVCVLLANSTETCTKKKQRDNRRVDVEAYAANRWTSTSSANRFPRELKRKHLRTFSHAQIQTATSKLTETAHPPTEKHVLCVLV